MHHMLNVVGRVERVPGHAGTLAGIGRDEGD
jgi:hypothetical protein